MAVAETAQTAARPSPRIQRAAPSLYAVLLAPGLLLFAVFFILPLLTMAALSVLTGNPVLDRDVTFTSAHYARIVADDFHLEVILTTFRIALYTTLACLAIGYPIAHLMARMASRTGRTLLLMAVLSPMLIGIVVRTYAWMTILSNQGVLNGVLQAAGLTTAPVEFMYNEFGIVVALVHIYVPFMVLTLTGVIGRIDPRLEEAATGLGAGRLRTFLEVTLPLSLPGVLAGSVLVFALAISAYVTPILMGGHEVTTLPMLIYQQIAGSFNIPFAAALGIVLLAASLVLILLYNASLARLSGDKALQ